MIKTITFNTDSVDEIDKAIRVLRGHLATAKFVSGQETRTDKQKSKFDAMTAIIETDISRLYSDDDGRTDYYVYAHCDNADKIVLSASNAVAIRAFAASMGMTHMPFYIGMGQAGRCDVLNRNEGHRKKVQQIRSLTNEVVITKIKNQLTRSEALALESKLIDIFGLITQGWGSLTNLDEGVKPAIRRLMYEDHLCVISSYHRHTKNIAVLA